MSEEDNKHVMWKELNRAGNDMIGLKHALINAGIKEYLNSTEIISKQVRQGHISGNEGIRKLSEAGLLILQTLRGEE